MSDTAYNRFKRSSVTVKEYAPTYDVRIHAAKYSLYRAAKTFSNTYMQIGRSRHY